MSTLKTIVDVSVDLALFINALLMLPLIVKILQVKNSNDFSLITYGGFNLFQLAMILHGFFVHDLVLILGMSFCFILNSLTVILIILYRQRTPIS